MLLPSVPANNLSRHLDISTAIAVVLTFFLTFAAGSLFIQKERFDANLLAARQQAHYQADRVNYSLQTLSQRITEIATNPMMAGGTEDRQVRRPFIEAFLRGYQRIAGVETQLMLVDAEGRQLADNGNANFDEKDIDFLRLQQASGEAAAVIRDDVHGPLLLGLEVIRQAGSGVADGAVLYKMRIADLQPAPGNALRWGLHAGDAEDERVPLRAPKRFDHLGFDVHAVPTAVEPANISQLIAWSAAIAGLIGLAYLLLVRRTARGLVKDLGELQKLADSVSLESAPELRDASLRTAEARTLAESLSRMLSRMSVELADARIGLERLAQVANAVPQLVWVADAHGRVQWMNDSWHSFAGSDRNDPGATERHWHDHVDADIRESMLVRWNDMLKKGQMEQYPVRLRGADGRYQSFQTSVTPVLDKQGLITHWIGMHTAVSTEVEQTPALNKDVPVIHSLLKKMNHKIRTPMTTLSGTAELVSRMKPDVKLTKYLDRIKTASHQISTILSEGLDLCHAAEGGMISLDDAPFDLHAVIRQACDQFAADMAARRLDFRLSIPDNVPASVVGDAVRLRQILVHLISNAVRHTRAGHIAVNVSLHNCEDDILHDKLTLLFEVEDTGIGLEPQLAGQLFAYPDSSGTAAASSLASTGLGLAFCKRVVEQMEGAIGVDSVPGQGSRFWFRISLSAAAEPYGQATAQTARSSLAGIRILLAEDNRFNQEIAQVFLEESGATVVLAENGAQALLYLQKSHVDCVLMDMQMPDMDGLEATRRIRQNPAWIDLPIIAMTGNTDVETRRLCLEAGMNDFIAKPFSPDSLLGAILLQVKGTVHDVVPVKNEGKDVAHPLPRLPGVDLNALAAMVGNDPEKLRFLVSLFIDTTQKAINELNAGVAAKDLTLLANLGHRHKSSAKAVGASELSELFAALEEVHQVEERLTKNGHRPDAKATALMTDVAVKFDTVRKAVVEWMDQSRKSDK